MPCPQHYVPLFMRDCYISTVAGDGTRGYSGDGGPATSAQLDIEFNALYDPLPGIAVDRAGNVYFADTHNNRIRKISSSGIITTVAGNGGSFATGDGGPAINAQVVAPGGIAVDIVGSLYIQSQCQILKVSPDGLITTIA